MARIDWFGWFLESIRDYSYGGKVWSNGEEILCKTEDAADAIEDLLSQLYRSQHEDVTIVTGYYEPSEFRDDNYGGWYYVTIE